MPELHASPRTESRQDTAHPSKPESILRLVDRICRHGSFYWCLSGIGFYGHGVILDPLRTLHGWSKATISSAITLYFLTAGIMGMIIGRQIDRYGPKWVLIIGSVVIGAGFVLLSRISTVWQLYLVYFMMALGFSCTSLVPVNTLDYQLVHSQTRLCDEFNQYRPECRRYRSGPAGQLHDFPLGTGSAPCRFWARSIWIGYYSQRYIFYPAASRPISINSRMVNRRWLRLSGRPRQSPLDYSAQMQVWTTIPGHPHQRLLVDRYCFFTGPCRPNCLSCPPGIISQPLSRGKRCRNCGQCHRRSQYCRPFVFGHLCGPLRQTACHHGVFSGSGCRPCSPWPITIMSSYCTWAPLRSA